MARITCDDCLIHVDNRYDLVLTAADRVGQLVSGLQQPLIDDEVLDDSIGTTKKDKPTVVALREIAAGLVTQQSIKETSEQVETEELDLNLDRIMDSFEEVDRQMEEERRQAEEKEPDK